MTTKQTATKEEIEYEKETCGRCGGNGKYSFNRMTGNRCFGCSGRGIKLTVDGAIAKKAFYNFIEDNGGRLKASHTNALKAVLAPLKGCKIITVNR